MKKLINLIFILVVFMVTPGIKSYSQVMIIGPQSVIRDEAHKRYLISDDFDAKIKQIDDNGAISIFSDVTVYFYVPRGMAIINNNLYVADQSVIRILDLKTGYQTDTLDMGLNLVGIASDGSKYLYISDDGLNKIYQMNISTYNTTNFVSSGLNTPHGLFYDSINNRLLICPWNTSQPIMSANLSTKALTSLTDTIYSYPEGIMGDGKGNYYVSEWRNYFGIGGGKVLFFGNGFAKSPIVVLNNLDGPSDFCFNKNKDTLVIPITSGNPTIIYKNIKTNFVLPKVDTAYAISNIKVIVKFNEAVDNASATNTANYTGLGTINSAVRTSSDTVTLTLATALVKGTPKTLTINNVLDQNTNPMIAAQQFQITFNGTTGIINYADKDFSVFPNPASDYFSVNYTMKEKAFTSITLYDLRGKIIRKYISQEQIPGNYHYIFNTETNPGPYLLEIKCNNESHITPLIIIK